AMGCTLFPGIGFRLLRFHPCHLDLLWLLFLQFFLELHQPYVISQRRLHLVPTQFLLNLLEQLLHDASLSLVSTRYSADRPTPRTLRRFFLAVILAIRSELLAGQRVAFRRH